MSDAAEVLHGFHAWLEGWESRVPQLTQSMPLAWRRDGLSAIYSRLEQLKIEDAALAGLLFEAQVKLSGARAWHSICVQAIENRIAPKIESEAAMMVNRGMAAEERMIAHRTKAAVDWSNQRAFERIVVLLEGAVDALRTLSWRVRDERNDLRAQFRAINVGIEIQELA